MVPGQLREGVALDTEGKAIDRADDQAVEHVVQEPDECVHAAYHAGYHRQYPSPHHSAKDHRARGAADDPPDDPLLECALVRAIVVMCRLLLAVAYLFTQQFKPLLPRQQPDRALKTETKQVTSFLDIKIQACI